MGQVKPHEPVLLVLAAFSRYEAALDWAMHTSQQLWGPMALCSPRFPFDQTTFYERTMGSELRKYFLAFEQLVDPAELVSIKLRTNELEVEYQRTNSWPEPRPLNLDPGYLTEAKLVLATTKDRDHRIYLDRGIFAEGTLYFHQGRWQTRPWTYPDYHSPGYHAFLNDCRGFYRRSRQASS